MLLWQSASVALVGSVSAAGEFIQGFRNIQPRHRGCVLTIGSFDGVHRGHRVILDQVKEKAKASGLPSTVMVFEPQPHEYFSRQRAPARLTRLREKVCALFAQDIDRVLCLKFDETLRSLSAEAYIEQVLVSALNVRHLVIGDDFRFGADRSGDFDMLCRAGQRHGFSVADTQTQLDGGERISSTRIRKLLNDDKLSEAKRLLGRPFSVSGRVVYGSRLGRTLGFPTANVGLGRYRSPVHGVYAVRVSQGFSSSRGNKELWQGVANVGVRPTVDGGEKPVLEVHLLDQNRDLYGKFIEVIFEKKVRDEKRFADIHALKAQIAKDCQTAQNFFASNPINDS